MYLFKFPHAFLCVYIKTYTAKDNLYERLFFKKVILTEENLEYRAKNKELNKIAVTPLSKIIAFMVLL